MKKYVSLMLFLCTINFAKSQYCNVHSSSEIISPTKEKTAEFLTRFLKEKLIGSELFLTSEKSSLAAKHFVFEQTIDDISIANSFVKISVANDGKIVSIYEQLVAVSEFQKSDYKPISLADFDMQNLTIESSEKVWWISHQQLEPALKVTIESNEHKKAMLIYTQTGVVDETPLSFHFAQDSMVSGKVFYPDPLTSSGNVYGGNYRDFGDIDTSFLNNERVTKTFRVEFDSLVFKLQSPHIELQDLDNDGTPIATSTSPTFNFTRSQKGFEDVNAYYHISTLQQRLVELGFSVSIPKVIIDPHGTSADNSFFTYPNLIYYGTGGVDDAEDADVVTHEYSHFLSRNAATNTNVGLERQGLDEGLGDYVAASYSISLNPFKKEWIFNWDGHNEFWNGRIVNSTRLYPTNVLNNIYKDGEMWSSTLMQIHDELGRGKTDSLVFESLYQYASNMTYAMAAQALLKTDSLLFNGNNFCVLYKHLYDRGYLPFISTTCVGVGIEPIGSANFKLINTKSGFKIESEEKIVGYEIHDLLGKSIYTSNENFLISRNELPKTIYLISVKTKDKNQVVRWWNGY